MSLTLASTFGGEWFSQPGTASRAEQVHPVKAQSGHGRQAVLEEGGHEGAKGRAGGGKGPLNLRTVRWPVLRAPSPVTSSLGARLPDLQPDPAVLFLNLIQSCLAIGKGLVFLDHSAGKTRALRLQPG